MAAPGADRQFTIILKVDNHMRKADLSVVYNNDPVVLENSINTLEHLLAKDDKYKVVVFDLEYTGSGAWHDHLIVIAQLCVRHHVRKGGHHQRSQGAKDFGLVLQKLVNIQGQYRVWGGEKNKQRDSLINLAADIIDPYYRDMKDVCDKDECVWHESRVNELDEEHIKYAAKNAYTSYGIYTRIVDMRKCLLPGDGEG
ncbi:hypothetical protein D1007_56076 [Hordeum vulgare]|nr:hypothetical protein D1007_56076 [Hordeum vulgare]